MGNLQGNHTSRNAPASCRMLKGGSSQKEDRQRSDLHLLALPLHYDPSNTPAQDRCMVAATNSAKPGDWNIASARGLSCTDVFYRSGEERILLTQILAKGSHKTHAHKYLRHSSLTSVRHQLSCRNYLHIFSQPTSIPRYPNLPVNAKSSSRYFATGMSFRHAQV